MLELAFSLSLNSESKVPHYKQLYLFIRQEIQAGHIKAGTKLPSIRALSDALNISKTTTEEAYQQLIAEGYIVSKARVGYFSLPPEDAFTDAPASTRTKPSSVAPLSNRSIEIDFHPARVDGNHFPRTLFKKLSNDVWNTYDNTLLDYGDAFGEWGLRKTLADYLHHARGVRCTPHQIIIGSGIQYSIGVLIELLQSDETVVGMEDPGYDKVLSAFRRAGVAVRPIALDSDGIDIEQLRKSDANLVYVTPSHQFPQGMVMPYSKRMQLLQWAKESGSFIIEDDYDGEFRYGERPIPSLQGLDANDAVIYIGTFSKSLSPSMRVNYMVLPPSLVEQFAARRHEWDSPVSRHHQLVLQAFMEQGHWERHVRRLRRGYRSKQAVLIQVIQAEMGERAIIVGQGAGLHVVLDVNTDKSRETLKERAESVGVNVYFVASAYSQEPTATVRVVLGFGGLSPDDLVEGIKRLRTCWFSR